ncbi:hypothetical protein B0H14DRAFT_23027 [Mycena olivaceomarginata]|nr:hypothetical protein B0H14DRAFT_23027 [Mycena olivaceomarginata]
MKNNALDKAFHIAVVVSSQRLYGFGRGHTTRQDGHRPAIHRDRRHFRPCQSLDIHSSLGLDDKILDGLRKVNGALPHPADPDDELVSVRVPTALPDPRLAVLDLLDETRVLFHLTRARSSSPSHLFLSSPTHPHPVAHAWLFRVASFIGARLILAYRSRGHPPLSSRLARSPPLTVSRRFSEPAAERPPPPQTLILHHSLFPLIS